MSYAQIIPEVFMGNREACDKRELEWDAIVHIGRADHPQNDCEYQRQCRSGNRAVCAPGKTIDHYVVMDYEDGAAFPRECWADLRDMYGAWATKKRGKILVHCHAGQTRAPTLVLPLVALLAECSIYAAIGLVHQANWEQRKMVANICVAPLEGLFKFRGTL